MNTIWKFPLARTDKQTVHLPAEFAILSVGLDPQDQICLWAAVTAGPLEYFVEILIVGTGNKLPSDAGDFLGTVNDGPFMWHVFTGPEMPRKLPADSVRGNG